jgi:hypothetical protein
MPCFPATKSSTSLPYGSPRIITLASPLCLLRILAIHAQRISIQSISASRDPHTDAVLSGRVCGRRSRHAHHRPNRHRQVSTWQDTSVNTGRPLRVNSSRYCSRSVDNSRATRMASHESSVSRHRRRIAIGRSFLFLPICRNGSIDRERNEGSQRLVVTIIARASGRYECI